MLNSILLTYTCAGLPAEQTTVTTESTNCIKFWQDHKDKYPKLYQLHICHLSQPSVFKALLLAKASYNLL